MLFQLQFLCLLCCPLITLIYDNLSSQVAQALKSRRVKRMAKLYTSKRFIKNGAELSRSVHYVNVLLLRKKVDPLALLIRSQVSKFTS